MKKIISAICLAGAGVISAWGAAAPAFPGGEEALNEYLVSNLKYPATALQNGIEGIVNVECTIMADGSVGTIKIVRMIDPDLEQEAIRLVKNMPAWTPAENGGSPVDATVTIPVTFTLPE